MQNNQAPKPDQAILDSLKLRFDELQKVPLDIVLPENSALQKPPDGFFYRAMNSVCFCFSNCKKCEKYFCTRCIDTWTSKKNSCPTCRGSPFVKGNVPIIQRETLKSIEFNCGKCTKTFKYEKAQEHFLQCQRAVTCLQECGKKEFFSTFMALQLHLKNDCPKMSLECARCKVNFIK